MTWPFSVPAKVTGGCLCGGSRYEVYFSLTHDWQNSAHDCQCTQCRKFSGCLALPFHVVDSDKFTWLDKSTYSEYSASPGVYRGFCNRCGGTLVWRKDSRPDTLQLTVGSFDEAFLIGTRESDKVKGEGGFGMALYRNDCIHFHTNNEIQGVTDHFSGQKYPQD